MSLPSKQTKVPPPLPTWLCKASWDGTSIRLLIPAKDEVDAKRRAWNKVAHTEGGDLCLKITVLGQV